MCMTLHRGHRARGKKKMTGWANTLSAHTHTTSTRCVRRDRPDSEWSTTKVTVILDLGGSNGCLGNLGLSAPRVWTNGSLESTGVKYLLQMFDT